MLTQDMVRRLQACAIGYPNRADEVFGRDRYRFEGEASLGQLLSGIVELPTIVASPRGFVEGCNVSFGALAA